MKKFFWLTTAILVAATGFATPPPFPQPNPGDEKLLIPFAAYKLDGALGTLWSSRVTVYNGGSKNVTVLPGNGGREVQPGQTKDSGVSDSGMQSIAGVIAYVPPNSTLSFDAVFFQENPAFETEAVAFPVVRENQLLHSTLQLVDIPNDTQHRVNVRVYDFQFKEKVHYRIRCYAASQLGADVLLHEELLTIQRDDIGLLDVYSPGRGSYQPSTPFGAISSLRIEVTPLDEHALFWAAASVTDNRTQHVQLVLP